MKPAPTKLFILPFKLDPALLAEIDRARGPQTRSFFIREALALRLRQLGVNVESDMIYPPDRTGRAAFSHQMAETLLNDAGDFAQPLSPPEKIKILPSGNQKTPLKP